VLPRDDEFLTAMAERVERFWADHVKADVPPDADAASRSTLAHVYPGDAGADPVVITDELAPHVHALYGALDDRDDADQRVDTAAALLQAAMGDAQQLVWPDGGIAATWNIGRTIDGANKDWRAGHAELVEHFTRPVDQLDVAKLVENHPELIGKGLRYRRTFTPKRPKRSTA
jgi:predicted phage-related endonuclease